VRRALILFELLAAAVVLGRGSHGAAHAGEDSGGEATPACSRAIGPDSAQGLYAALKELRGPDACVLSDVRTDRSVMHVVWTKAGVTLPVVEIRPADCAVTAAVRGPQFSLAAPPDFAAACPTALEKMKTLVSGDTLGAAIRADGHDAIKFPRSAALILAGGLGLLAIIGGAVFLWRRRRRTS
jgi:hypothetical protein